MSHCNTARRALIALPGPARPPVLLDPTAQAPAACTRRDGSGGADMLIIVRGSSQLVVVLSSSLRFVVVPASGVLSVLFPDDSDPTTWNARLND